MGGDVGAGDHDAAGCLDEEGHDVEPDEDHGEAGGADFGEALLGEEEVD